MAALLVLGLGVLGITGCGSESNKNITYELTVDGTITASGTVSFLDYDINVYQDEASNPCGTCADRYIYM